ncbi:MAG: apolipoprotein N-acyltransferase [Hirschia sp.]|nr:apolipoprotein N-acyltransferase [Hirschia sp.]MBF18819.1 apolipoprotein N-acyltransferase [Hirschia sp.]
MTETKSPGDLRQLVGEGAITAFYNRIRDLTGWRAGLVAFGAGALSNLSFAPTYLWPVFSCGLMILVWMLDGTARGRHPRRGAFWRAFCFALGLFGVGFHWVAFAFLVNPGTHLAFIWMAALLPIGLALIWGGVVRVMINWWNEGPGRVVLLGISLFIAEWIRGHLFGGFPWNLPGMVWAPGGAISQSASLFGIYGLSLLTLVAFCGPAALLDPRSNITAKGGAMGRAIPVVASALIFGMLWGWGAQRLGDSPVELTESRVRLVDVGAPQAEKFEKHGMVLRRYRELTGSEHPGDPSLVIWPEGALPYLLLQDPAALDLVTERLGNRKLIAGTVFEDRQLIPKKAYNALAVLDSQAVVRGAEQIYYKHRLVPFGELVPFRNVAAMIGIGALQQLATDGFYSGPKPTTLSANGMPDFLPLICYEALFPGLLPRRRLEMQDDADFGLDPQPKWLVNISIDAWFGPLWAPYQHMEHARYRAIEEGLPMVRVASRGKSGVIDAHGRITALATAPIDDPANPPGWKPRLLDAQIPASIQPTVYGRWRDLWVWLCLIGVFLGMLVLPRD